MYKYHPLTLESLGRLLEHEVVGQRARYERYAAEMLFIIASGQHIDAEKSPRFGTIVDEVYQNPFVKREKPMSAEDIRQYTLRKVREALKAYQ